MNVGNYATRGIVTLAPNDSIDRAIGLMEQNGFHHLVVVGPNGVVGMLSDRDILISTGWMLSVERRVAAPRGRAAAIIGPTRVAQIMTHPIVQVNAEDACRLAASLMLKHKISALPVLEHERLAGVITDTDLIRWLDTLTHHHAPADLLLRRSVRDRMRTEVVQVGAAARLDEVVGLFRSRRIRHVPVVENGVVVGIISDRDVRRALGWSSVRDAQAEAEGRQPQPEPQTAAEVMQSQPLVIDPQLTLGEAMRLMLGRGIHSLPVIERDRLVGILTQSDLIRAIAHEELL